MVRIPGGPFQRGVDDRRGPDEGPARSIHLSPFRIDRREVTRERFAEFAAATGRVTAAGADSPGAGVAADFVNSTSRAWEPLSSLAASS